MLAPIPIIEPAPVVPLSEEESVAEDMDREPEVQFNEFCINNEAINRILQNPQCADKRVCCPKKN